MSARVAVAGIALIGANSALQTAVAEGDTRTLTFHHLHTKEDLTVTFKRNGRYDEAALKKLNWFLRDWRKDEETRMDPHLIDLVWETYREVGGTEPVQIISAYRSPATNAMLRNRSSSSGVAETSQHMAGHALDFAIPGVPLAKVREVGLRLQRGGVGFYPSSGSPFVHLDTGSIRAWPRATYAELQRIFPDGRTVHISSDGRPLPGYALALADVERRGKAPSSVSLAAAQKAGVIDDGDVAEATTVAADNKPQYNLLASLFGFGNKNTDETADETTTATASAKRAPRQQVARAAPAKPVATERIVPLPSARPAVAPVVVAAAVETEALAPATFQTASFDSRGYWPAAAEPDTTASTSQPLAYAAEDRRTASATRTPPMGKGIPAASHETKLMPAAGNTTIAVKSALPPMFGDQRAAGPWLRAAMLTPSVQSVMTATPFGALDPRPLSEQFHKPADALTMTFSIDPTLGLQASRFSGSAVVFLATTTFITAKTAALR